MPALCTAKGQLDGAGPSLGRAASVTENGGKLCHIGLRLRSAEGQNQLGNAGAAVLRCLRQAFLGGAGDREGGDEAFIEHRLGRLAAAQPCQHGDDLRLRNAAAFDNGIA